MQTTTTNTTAKREPKTTTVKVIQQHYGYGWEDNSEYNPADKELIKHDLKEYRLTGYATRLITRRVKYSERVEQETI